MPKDGAKSPRRAPAKKGEAGGAGERRAVLLNAAAAAMAPADKMYANLEKALKVPLPVIMQVVAARSSAFDGLLSPRVDIAAASARGECRGGVGGGECWRRSHERGAQRRGDSRTSTRRPSLLS